MPLLEHSATGARVSSLCLCADHSAGADAFDTYRKAYAQTLVS